MSEISKFKPPEAKPEITAFEEALYAQQQLLQQVYSELDAEREASATAASEALSMILRLQGEKAALQMEANQYKRVAEEKMHHAEDAMAGFEDLIYQREVEIATLEFQVQAYRCGLLSMDCNDLCGYEKKFPDDLLIQQNDELPSEKRVVRDINRLLRHPMEDLDHKKFITNTKGTAILMPDPIPGNPEELNDLEKKTASPGSAKTNTFCDKLKKLDEQVQEISDVEEPGRRKHVKLQGCTRLPSLFLQGSISSASEVHNRTVKVGNLDSKTCQGTSANVQDVYQVPRSVETRETCSSFKGKQRPEEFDAVDENTIKSLCSSPSIELPKPATSSSSQSEYHELSRRVERLEGEICNSRQEIVREGGEEELDLLKEIREQLKSIQCEMRSLGAKRRVRSTDPSLDPLRQAMLYFWM